MRRAPEAQVQRAIVQALRLCLPAGSLVHHSGHEQRRGGADGRRAQAIGVGMGVLAGFPDLVVLTQGRALFLEVKAPGGTLSPAQRACLRAMAAQGFPVAVVRSVEDAIGALAEAGIAVRRPALRERDGSVSGSGRAGEGAVRQRPAAQAPPVAGATAPAGARPGPTRRD